jgi:hypothetical protein
MSTEVINTKAVQLYPEDLPARALAFLRGIGTFLPIRMMLAKHGYTEAEHQLGWRLLQNVSGFFATFPKGREEAEVRDAIATLDATDEPLFRRARAALQRFHPEQCAFVFDGLAATAGAGAVLTIATFLDRVDALEHGADREATREADRLAIATLAGRGIDEVERARLRDLVVVAQTGAMPHGASPREEEMATHMAALGTWYADWTETARAIITRRDLRIRLGLARRKRPKKDGDVVDEIVSTTPTAPVAAPTTPVSGPADLVGDIGSLGEG